MLLTTTRAAPFDQRRILAISAAILAPFFIYLGTAKSIVAIWNSSDTFAHGYAILPISLWMIWKRKDSLPLETTSPYWPALLLLAACGFGWLLADLAAVQVVQQYALVAMLPLIVLGMLGPALTRAMAFPLLFLLLAVPFGEIFIDPLIHFTADFTVAALQATGIPVLRSGTHFDIPSGSWSVVEACSGVRYLISSFTLGCLYAYLTYRSVVRQVLFILLSIVVPIIANGLRAYMIVMIGHLSGMELAVGVDHLIYGWLFFGLVMFAMLWIGSFWREDMTPPSETGSQSNLRVSETPASAASSWKMALLTIGCLAIWPLYSGYIERAAFNPQSADLAGFHSNWKEAPAFSDWKPHFLPANAELLRFFESGSEQAGVFISYYRNQHDGSKLISSSNQLVAEKDAMWRKIGSTTRQESFNNLSISVREARIQGATGSLLVWSWYWIDGHFTANDYVGKLRQAKQELMMQGDDGAAIVVFAPYAGQPEPARAALRQFLSENLPSLEATLRDNAGRRH